MLEIASPRRANAWGGIGSSGCEPSRVSWFRARRVHVRGVDRPQIWPVERRPGLPRPGVVGQDSMKPMKLRSSLRRTAMSSKEFVPQNNWTKAIRFQKKTAANLLSSQIRRPTGRENSCWYGKKGLAKAQNSCSGAPNPRSGALELLLFCLRLKGLGEGRLSNFFGVATLLDPRFKQLQFASNEHRRTFMEGVRRRIESEFGKMPQSVEEHVYSMVTGLFWHSCPDD